MIILRQEQFGGLAFNTHNACELWLDHEAYQALRAALEQKERHPAPEARSLLDRLAARPGSKALIKDGRKPVQSPANGQLKTLSAPNLVDLNITDQCNLACPHCYINSRPSGSFLARQNFGAVLDELVRNRVLQVALGGGEPTLHPDLPLFLRKLRQNRIVPNLTTNGRALPYRTVLAMAKYCGAVALSLEGRGSDFEARRGFAFRDFCRSADKLKAAGVPLAFHITASASNLDKLPGLVRKLLAWKPYGLVFLAYKPIGRGRDYDSSLATVPQTRIADIFGRILLMARHKTKLGFDCCFTPGLLSLPGAQSLAGCSAGRTSLAVMPNLDVLPCSFLETKNPPNLGRENLKSIWHGRYLADFRARISDNLETGDCRHCPDKHTCLAGCPLMPLISCPYEGSVGS